ncbi:MAG: hypothetical protein ACOYXW_12395 [Actinomycetota bacterium]
MTVERVVGGTIPAVLAVQRSPEKYAAFVGTEQMVDVRETDELFHADTLAWAAERGNDELVATLRELGPPPYADLLDAGPGPARGGAAARRPGRRREGRARGPRPRRAGARVVRSAGHRASFEQPKLYAELLVSELR